MAQPHRAKLGSFLQRAGICNSGEGGGGGKSSGPGNKGGSGTPGLFKGPVVRDSKDLVFNPNQGIMHFSVKLENHLQ